MVTVLSMPRLYGKWKVEGSGKLTDPYHTKTDPDEELCSTQRQQFIDHLIENLGNRSFYLRLENVTIMLFNDEGVVRAELAMLTVETKDMPEDGSMVNSELAPLCAEDLFDAGRTQIALVRDRILRWHGTKGWPEYETEKAIDACTVLVHLKGEVTRLELMTLIVRQLRLIISGERYAANFDALVNALHGAPYGREAKVALLRIKEVSMEGIHSIHSPYVQKKLADFVFLLNSILP
jgi:hypothetical protein